MLWVDKHRPGSFQKLTFHNDLSARLQSLVEGEDFPHLLFFGPSGAGKKTRILCLLKEIYGSGVEKVKLEVRSFQINSQKVEMPLIMSAYHIEMNPGEAGNADRVIIQEVLKEIAQSPPVNKGANNRSFKVVILSDVDQMSRGAQQSLRRTMEKYTKCCRLILCCQSSARVIEPIRSRCLNIRVPGPTENEICQVLEDVAKRERIIPSAELNLRIAQNSGRNLRKAILILEACRAQQYPFTADQQIHGTDWEYFISQVSNEILEEQSPQRLLVIRGKLYELLSNCIPPEIILQTLVKELLLKTDNEMKSSIISCAAQCDGNLRNGSKAIFHLEAFVARFMAMYKKFMSMILE